MIFDRTANDVQTAILIRDTKVKRNEYLTVEDLETLERGFLTQNTLNRIENKQDELKRSINEMGYWNTSFYNRIWEDGDIFDTPNFNRVIKNITLLMDAFFVFDDTPNTFTTNYRYDNINAIEKTLADLETILSDANSRIKRCGTFRAGQ